MYHLCFQKIIEKNNTPASKNLCDWGLSNALQLEEPFSGQHIIHIGHNSKNKPTSFDNSTPHSSQTVHISMDVLSCEEELTHNLYEKPEKKGEAKRKYVFCSVEKQVLNFVKTKCTLRLWIIVFFYSGVHKSEYCGRNELSIKNMRTDVTKNVSFYCEEKYLLRYEERL